MTRALAFIGLWALTTVVIWTIANLVPLLWRRVLCACGYHGRETVEDAAEWRPDDAMPLPNCYRRYPIVRRRCLDCGAKRTLATDVIFTPSRRYALDPTRQKHGRAA